MRTANEVVESLTGFDEIAIEQNFNIDPYRDAETKPMLVMRALAFVEFRREGLPDAEAKNEALGLSLKQLQARFEPDPEEVDESEPETDTGKES